MEKKFDLMQRAFREMSRIADNETASSSRRDFIRSVRKFEKTYQAWRDLIPEQDALPGHVLVVTIISDPPARPPRKSAMERLRTTRFRGARK